MQYFRNSELIKLYNISDKTIRNWIESAQDGKLELELCSHDGKIFIADSLKNDHLIEDLVQRSRKYRNHRSHKKLRPTRDFYELYEPDQITDIIRSLDAYREFPQQYRYHGQGAVHWDAYLHKLYRAGKSNYLTAQLGLLQDSMTYIDRLLERYKNVNLVDLGVGNGLASKDLLGHLDEIKKLKKYIGVDSSRELLAITEENIKTWFKNSVVIKKSLQDIVHDRFGGLLGDDSYDEDAASTLNLILFLGGTITNFREPAHALQTIRDSMRNDDLLISSLRLDTNKARRFFDFNAELEHIPLPLHDRSTLELLGIDETLYEVEPFFNEAQRCRVMQVKFRASISIYFQIGSYQKTVEFQKGESLLLCRAWHYSEIEAIELYRKSGHNIMQTIKSPDEEYLLIISKIKTDKPSAAEHALVKTNSCAE